MFYSWAYVILNAISALLRQISASNLSPTLILLIGSTFAVIFFNGINFASLKFVYQRCIAYKKDWFKINLTIAIMWLCAVYSPGLIGASLYTFFYFTVLGLMGIVSLHKRKDNINFSSTIGIVLLLLYIIITTLMTKRELSEILGIGLACLGGITGFIYSMQSAKFMHETSLNPSQILAVRFYLAIVFSIVLLSVNPVIAPLNSKQWTLASAVVFFSFIAPLYLSQKGIQKIGPEINAIIISTTPLSTAILEQLYFQNIDYKQFLIYIAYSIFASLPFTSKWYRKIRVPS